MRFVGNQTRFFHEFWEFSGEIRLGIFGNSRFSRRFPGSSRRSRKTRKSGIRSSWIRSCCSRGSRTWSRSWKTGSDPRTSEPGIPRRWRWEFPKKVPGKKFPKISLAVLGTDTEGQSGAGIPRAGKSGNGVAFPKFSGSGVSRCFPAFPEQLFPVFSHIPEGFFPVFFPPRIGGSCPVLYPNIPQIPALFPDFSRDFSHKSLSLRNSRIFPLHPLIPSGFPSPSPPLSHPKFPAGKIQAPGIGAGRGAELGGAADGAREPEPGSGERWEFREFSSQEKSDPLGIPTPWFNPSTGKPNPSFPEIFFGNDPKFLLFGGLWDHRFPWGREFWDALDPGVSG